MILTSQISNNYHGKQQINGNTKTEYRSSRKRKVEKIEGSQGRDMV